MPFPHLLPGESAMKSMASSQPPAAALLDPPQCSCWGHDLLVSAWSVTKWGKGTSASLSCQHRVLPVDHTCLEALHWLGQDFLQATLQAEGVLILPSFPLPFTSVRSASWSEGSLHLFHLFLLSFIDISPNKSSSNLTSAS